MMPREVLRAQLGIDEDPGLNAPQVSDEEILNVLRREKENEDGEDELTTKEIASSLPIKRKQTSNRLKKMAPERVQKRRAGNTDMWSLAPTEPETVMNPELGRAIEWSSRARRKAINVRWVGVRVAAFGLALLLVGMSLLLSESAVSFVTSAFLAFGYAAGAVGAFIAGMAVFLYYIGDHTPKVVEWLLID